MIYNLDGVSCEVYFEFNLIEARAAAILTPHLMRHAPAVFSASFTSLLSPPHSCDEGW